MLVSRTIARPGLRGVNLRGRPWLTVLEWAGWPTASCCSLWAVTLQERRPKSGSRQSNTETFLKFFLGTDLSLLLHSIMETYKMTPMTNLAFFFNYHKIDATKAKSRDEIEKVVLGTRPHYFLWEIVLVLWEMWKDKRRTFISSLTLSRSLIEFFSTVLSAHCNAKLQSIEALAELIDACAKTCYHASLLTNATKWRLSKWTVKTWIQSEKAFNSFTLMQRGLVCCRSQGFLGINPPVRYLG